MKKLFKPTGVCAQAIEYEIIDGVVRNVVFHGGCPGNRVGLAALIEGQKIETIIERLRDIPCHTRGTSCPDQLAKALMADVASQQK